VVAENNRSLHKILSVESSRNTSRTYSVSLRADRAVVNLPMVSNLRVQGQSPRLIASRCEAMLMSGMGFVYFTAFSKSNLCRSPEKTSGRCEEAFFVTDTCAARQCRESLVLLGSDPSLSAQGIVLRWLLVFCQIRKWSCWRMVK
jgi:hypothetical protein